MGIRAEADQRAERREDQRQRRPSPHQPGRDAQFDDHHAVERADQQHHRHPDGHLEQRQAQQARQRQSPSPHRQTAGSAGRACIQPRATASVKSCSSRESAPAPAKCRIRWRRARCGPASKRASARLARSERAIVRSATGSIAGARSPRGNSADGMHRRRAAGVSGANVKSSAASVRCARPRQHAARIGRRDSGSASPSRRHDRTGRARIEHVAGDETRSRPAPEPLGDGARAQCRSASATGRSATTSRATPRSLDRERAGAAARVEQARAAQVGRQPGQQRRPHAVAAGAHRGADAGRPARPRSASPRHRPPCGRNRSRARRGAPR